MSENVWQLLRYARYKRSEGSMEGDWEHYTSTDKDRLELTLVLGNLLLSYGKSVMESYALSSGKTCLRAVCKGDSMLIIYRLKDKSHRFRVKFDKSVDGTGEENCRKCADVMASSFPVKVVPTSSASARQPLSGNTDAETESTLLEGEVTLAQIAEVLTGQKTGMSLPETYLAISDFSELDLGSCLRLCLTDPTFPAFVGQVEKEIEKLKREL